MNAPAATSFSHLKEVEMQGRNWKLAMLLATTVGVMASGSSLAIAQNAGQQLPQSARDPDVARQEPKGLRDADAERQQPQGLRDADAARQQPQGLKDADAARQQPQGLRDSEHQQPPAK
jgi:hypothetical protein